MVLYGVLGSDGEIVIECKELPQIEGTDNYIWDEANRLLRVNYLHGEKDTHILIDDLELVIVNKERAYRSWDIALKQDTLTLVSDAYFLRDYSGDKDSLNLTIETLPCSSHYTIVLPREPQRVSLNHQDIPFEWDESTHHISFDLETPSLPQEVIQFSKALFKKEDLSNGDWRHVGELNSLEELDILDRGYVRYKAHFTVDEVDSMVIEFYSGSAKTGKFAVGDPTMVFINDQFVPEASGWKGERVQLDPVPYLKKGDNTMMVVLEKIGRNVGGPGALGKPKGLKSILIYSNDKALGHMIEDWKIKEGLYGQNKGYHTPEFNDNSWEEVNLGNWKQTVRGAKDHDGIGWYRLSFNPDLPVDWEVPLKLHLEAETDAIIYLNGILIGQYHGIGWQRDFYLPEPWIKTNGQNVVIVAVRNSGKEGGIYEAYISPYSEFSVKQDKVNIIY
jgi:hypothetical protein